MAKSRSEPYPLGTTLVSITSTDDDRYMDWKETGVGAFDRYISRSQGILYEYEDGKRISDYGITIKNYSNEAMSILAHALVIVKSQGKDEEYYDPNQHDYPAGGLYIWNNRELYTGSIEDDPESVLSTGSIIAYSGEADGSNPGEIDEGPDIRPWTEKYTQLRATGRFTLGPGETTEIRPFLYRDHTSQHYVDRTYFEESTLKFELLGKTVDK